MMNNLKQARMNAGMTQSDLGKRTGFNKSVISRIENGSRKMRTEEAMLFADVLSVTTEYLIGEAVAERDYSSVKIPVLGEVIAGIPIDAVEHILDYEEIPNKMAKQGEFFALKIKGHSMEPVIFENDIVIIRKQNYCNDGDISVVLINNQEATVKKVFKTSSTLTLIAFNSAVYTPTSYTDKECRELPVSIIGKVVEIRRKV